MGIPRARVGEPSEARFLFALLLLLFPFGIQFTDKGNEIDNQNPPIISDLLRAH